MPIQLVIPTESVIKSEKTAIGASQTAVGTALELENNQGLVSGDFIRIGREASDTAELIRISSVNADQKNIVLVSATKFIHLQFEEVEKYAYNQRKIYRKLVGESSFSVIATIDIEVDRPIGTFYTDPTGVDTAQYKATYFNSHTSVESDTAEAKVVYGSGGDHYCMIDEIREESGFTNNDNISDERVFRHRARAEGEVNGSLINRYTLPLSANTYWEDSPAQEIIRQVTALLAAGWLMWQEYPDDRSSGSSKDGLEKIKEARSILKSIREESLVLLGSDQIALAQTTGLRISGYPNNSLTSIPDSNHDDEQDHIFQLGKSW